MKPISAEEHQFLSFFEVEPVSRDRDEPWQYNDSVYTVHRDGLTLTFAIDPAYKDIRITLTKEESQFYDLSLTGVDDVLYHKDSNKESLECILTDNHSILLSLKPHIRILESRENLA